MSSSSSNFVVDIDQLYYDEAVEMLSNLSAYRDEQNPYYQMFMASMIAEWIKDSVPII